MHHSEVKCASCRPLLSLEELSIIKVTTIFCNNEQLLSLITKCHFARSHHAQIYKIASKKWMPIQLKANELISQIPIGALKNRIMEYLWPVAYKILFWKSVNVYPFGIGSKFPCQFYWTDRGRINSAKTVQCIISEKNISVRNRFILACSACLRKELLEIWTEMSPEDKNYFYSGAHERFSPLLLFWAHYLEGSDNAFEDYMTNAVFCTIQYGLSEAVKYLFSISTTDARRRMSEICFEKFSNYLVKVCFLSENEVDLAYFLFFEMTDENQEIYFNIPHVLTLSLLLYSSEDKYILNFLSAKLHYNSWMQQIIYNGELVSMIFFEFLYEVNRNFDYDTLFYKLWRMIPDRTKLYYRDSDIGARFLLVLIRDHFQFLLRKDAPVYLSEMLSSNEINTSGKPFRFHQRKWDFLKFLIREVTTVFSLRRYKKDIMVSLCLDIDKSAWKRILKFVSKMRKKSKYK